MLVLFSEIVFVCCVVFRIWLRFNKDRDDYQTLYRIWRFGLLPVACFSYAAMEWPMFGASALLSIALSIYAAVWLVSRYFSRSGPVVSGSAADVRSDAALTKKLAEPFDPCKYIDINKGIFVGLNSARKPVYLRRQVIDKNHIDFLGESGVGKSSFAGVVISQLAALGETIVIFDPKNDRKLPGALARAGREWGNYPVHVIDLRPVAGCAQVNPFAGCRDDQVEELLQVALELGKTGDAGVDFFRGKDREATSFIAAAMEDGKTSMLEIIEKAGSDERVTEQENLWRELRQVARLKAFHTTSGLNLADVLGKPGVLYIIGSTTRLEVVAGQKLLLQRVLQIIDERADDDRPVAIFLDELKYILSPAALRAAGTVRDRNCHLFFAHQSLGDLADCPGLSPVAVHGAIWGNSGIKIVYKVQDSKTAKELQEVAGTTAEGATSVNQSDDKNSVSTKVEKGTYMPAHVFTHLPKPVDGEASVGVVFGLGTAWYLSTRYIETGPAPTPVPAPLEIRGATTKAAAAFGEPAGTDAEDYVDDLSDILK